MAKTKQIVKIATIITFLFLLIKCANQISPPGGEVDKTPPTIVYSYPENGITNFTDNEIEIGFSEYINKRNMTDAFFVSPLIEGQPNYSWTNKTVYIELTDSLKQNTTYSIIIGTEITDVNNNNNMVEPFILTFSTGSKIDSGTISGKVYTDKADGTLIFAYKVDSLMPNIYDTKPFYLSQINDKGLYKFSGLADGEYLLFAIRDEFKDLVYNIGNDLLGIPFSKTVISQNNRSVAGVNYLLQKEDTLAPNISNVTMTDRNHLIAEFSEALDSTKFGINNFSIIDSTANKTYPINYWYKTSSKKHEYVLCFTDSLSIDNSLYLFTKDIFDKKGNKIENVITSFIVSENADTNQIKINKVITPFSANKIDYLTPSFIIEFSDAFNPVNINKSILFRTSDSLNIPIKIERMNDAKYEVKTLEKLKQNSNYEININLTYLYDVAGNNADTTIVREIKTTSDLDFSGVSGLIKSESKRVNVVLKSLEQSSLLKQTEMEQNSTFKFEKVLPGKYLIWAYEDIDSSGNYSYGKLEPFEYSEYFAYYPDTLNLRARWPVGDVEINLLNK